MTSCALQSRCSCISFCVSFLMSGRLFRWQLELAGVIVRMLSVQCRWRLAKFCSSCSLAKLVTADKELGRNIFSLNRISSLRPAVKQVTMKDSANPSVLFAKFSNCSWYSCTLVVCRSFARRPVWSSKPLGPNRRISACVKSCHRSMASERLIQWNHYSAFLSRWKEAMLTHWLGGVWW